MKEFRKPVWLEEYLTGSKKNEKRAFISSIIEGWEKKHYSPDPDIHFSSLSEAEKKEYESFPSCNNFLFDYDFITYTAPNDEFVFVIKMYRDEVQTTFIFDENSKTMPESSGYYIHPEWARAVALNTDLKKIFWEPKSSNRPRSLCTQDHALFNTDIAFESNVNLDTKIDFDQLNDSLLIFKKHFNIPNDVIDDITSHINARKAKFLTKRAWLAEEVSQRPDDILRQVRAILKYYDIGSGIFQYFFNFIKWYAEHNNPDLAFFLQKAVPFSSYSKSECIQMAQYVKGVLISHYEQNGGDKRLYFENLSEISLEIARMTNDKTELACALRLLTELSGGCGFEADTDVDQEGLYLNLLVKYASQVGQLKAENNALKKLMSTGSSHASVSQVAVVAAPRVTNGAGSASDAGPKFIPL